MLAYGQLIERLRNLNATILTKKIYGLTRSESLVLLSKYMKLRDHPLMTRQSGMASWPPEWRRVGRDGGTIRGELGTLQDVSMHDLIENKIFLAMERLDERYITVLAFDDATFAKQLYPLLLNNVGRDIREIGDLALSHLL